MPVILPNQNPKQELARKLFDAVVSQVPLVGGPYAAMLSVTHPAQIELLHAQWMVDVTAAINNLEQILGELMPTIIISEDATALGCWISKQSEYGIGNSVEFEKLGDAFPDASKQELEDACGELSYLGFATTSGAISANIISIRPMRELFAAFDPVVFDGANPRADAALAGRLILDEGGTVTAQTIMDRFDWSIRRYNPAISIICDMIDAGRRGTRINPHFVTHYVMPNPAERAEIRYFADTVLGRN